MVAQKITEVIFVGLPGCTHHYGGLSGDNVAATINRGGLSNPRQAALQALELVRLLTSLGVEAAILPPQLRPHLPLLRQHFSGDDAEVIAQAAKSAPQLLEKASSSSAMWTANAATIAPITDCADHKLHLTVANLFSHLHRRIEAEDTFRVLSAIFKAVPDCTVHPPLSAIAGLWDEGAANHMRLSPSHSDKGLHVFVYGTDNQSQNGRQTLSASKAVRALHHISDAQALFIRQNPDAIAAGVFHNDVIAVSNEYVLLAHEEAYAGGRYDIERIAQAYAALHPGKNLTLLTVSEEELSLEELVHSYLFNSQIVTKPDGAMAVIAPIEAQTLYEGKAASLLERIRADSANPIDEVHYADLRQSMRNGGGPACLRLRVPVTESQLTGLRTNVRVLADELLLEKIARLVEHYYPEELSPADLGKPELYQASQAMLAELSEVMRVPLIG